MYSQKSKQTKVEEWTSNCKERSNLGGLRSPLRAQVQRERRMVKMTGIRDRLSSFEDERLVPREMTETILARRQKDLDYGRNTDGYRNYIALVPKEGRSEWQPKTPDKFQTCSRRTWDWQVRKWRRTLHDWDKTDNNTSGTESSSKKKCLFSNSSKMPPANNTTADDCSNEQVSSLETREFEQEGNDSTPDLAMEGPLGGYKTWEEMFLEECGDLEEPKENEHTIREEEYKVTYDIQTMSIPSVKKIEGDKT